MDRSRLAGHEGLVFVEDVDDLPRIAHDFETIVVDLSRPGVLAIVGELRAVRVVGFAPHVQRELLERARLAGCDEAVPRSVLFARFADLVGTDRRDR